MVERVTAVLALLLLPRMVWRARWDGIPLACLVLVGGEAHDLGNEHVQKGVLALVRSGCVAALPVDGAAVALRLRSVVTVALVASQPSWSAPLT